MVRRLSMLHFQTFVPSVALPVLLAGRKMRVLSSTHPLKPIPVAVQSSPTMINVAPDNGEFAAQGKTQALDTGASTLVLAPDSSRISRRRHPFHLQREEWSGAFRRKQIRNPRWTRSSRPHLLFPER
jgi:hypothetical protein